MITPARPDDTEGVRLSLADGVATLTLHNPRRKNAITPPMWGELAEAFRWMAHDEAVRTVVVTGAGDDFCSGADLSEGPKVHATAYMRYINEGPLALHALSKPTIARVDGIAAGAGLNLALGCDLVVASDRARFSEIFAKRALSIDYGGSWLLPHRVGLAKAKELALLAPIIDAAEAERIGLVNRVVPDAELDQVVDEWASRLAAGPPIALAVTKRMVNRSFEQTFEQALRVASSALRVRRVGIWVGSGDWSSITSQLVYDAETGSFSSSNELLNRLDSAIRWGGKSNFVDIPTDCPQRDERQGWTGDIAVFASTAAYQFDMSRFFDKWLRDVSAEQSRGGGIPMVVPRAGDKWPVLPTACWGDSCVLVPWAEYLARGDLDLLRRQYPTMKRFLRAAKRWAGRRPCAWLPDRSGQTLDSALLHVSQSLSCTNHGQDFPESGASGRAAGAYEAGSSALTSPCPQSGVVPCVPG